MAKPYTVRGRWYDVPNTSGLGKVQRPTKNAAGMHATRQRSGHRAPVDAGYDDRANIAARIAVNGTCDDLAGMFNFDVTRGTGKRCKCCGQSVRPIILSDRGRRKLQRMRARKAAI